MNSMSNYDAWLTTDRLADQQEAYAEEVIEAWGTYVDTMGEYFVIPYEAHEPDHPEHAIYEAWENLLTVVQAYENRLLAEQEWAAMSDEERGSKRLPCVVCGVILDCTPSAVRAWCVKHSVDGSIEA